MKRKKIYIYVLCLTLLMQILLPLSMIFRREYTLKTGTQYRFKTAPVDPVDPFRGRYVALAFTSNEIMRHDDEEWYPGEMVYALLAVNHEGYAQISRLSRVKPNDEAYIKLKVSHNGMKYIQGEAPQGRETFKDHEGKAYHYRDVVYVHFPFDRLYMEETQAPRAETLYREAQGAGKGDTYVIVRVKNGFAVLEDLYIAGRSVYTQV
jgi:uncharacterized membrane-anchored protein